MTNASRADVEESAPTDPVRRLAGLDGLRGMALALIVLIHVLIILPEDGYSHTPVMVVIAQICRHGLTFFFVLSGYLIYRPFASALAQNRPLPSIRNYAVNRLLRIWPAYLVILATATIILPWGVVTQQGSCPNAGACDRQVIGRLTDPLSILANATLTQGWFPSTAFTGLSVSWSLVTEVGFYVMMPLLALLATVMARRISPTASAFMPAIIMIVIGAGVRWGTHALWLANGHVDDIPFGPTWYAVFNRGPLGQADTFAMGMLMAAVVAWSRSLAPAGQVRLRRGIWSLLFASPVALALAVALGARSGELVTEAVAVGASALMAVMLLPQAGAPSRAIVAIYETRLMRYLGEYSLSGYLWHYPTVLWFRANVEWVRFDSLAGLFLAYLVVAVPISALSWITYHAVEKPAMYRKRRT